LRAVNQTLRWLNKELFFSFTANIKIFVLPRAYSLNPNHIPPSVPFGFVIRGMRRGKEDKEKDFTS
jgi:hypothetical protein